MSNLSSAYAILSAMPDLKITGMKYKGMSRYNGKLFMIIAAVTVLGAVTGGVSYYVYKKKKENKITQ